MSFSMDQLRSLGRDIAMVSQASLGTSSSKEFLDLVKAIGESKSKAEEDRIMAAEIEHLKANLSQPDVSRKKMKEYIVRLIYVDILGHDASFGYINAVKMTHDDNLLYKRTGYLACTLFLDDCHDLIILIVNTLQKDLKSDNHLIVCAALCAVCKLINEETIPAVLPQVIDLVSHPKELVRKKAVMALHRFHQRSPSSVSHVLNKFKEALCDKDPSVMGASLCALYDLIVADPRAHRNLVPSFLSILKQVVEGRLPNTFNYHKTPAPFIQIKILKLLALLGAGDAAASELIYPAIADIIRKGDSKSNIGNAILYESICTGASIVPSSQLLVMCAEITSKFLKSDSHNLKYMGIDALGRIVKINPEFANEHQIAVIDCLEDPDDTLKRKTLDLLYKMTRPANVEVIVEKMLEYLREEQKKLQSALHLHGKTDLASRVIELAERFAPSNQWYIETMNTVFEVAGDVVRPQVAHDLMRLIAEGGSGGDEEEDDSDSRLRSSAVESYVQLVDEPDLPPLMLQVICWVLGEYATSDGHMAAQDVLAKLCDIASSHAADDSVRAYVLTAMTKIVSFEVARNGSAKLTPEASSFVDDMTASHSTDLQQRAYELRGMASLPRGTAAVVMPEDASCEDIEIDSSLHFLDAFVSEAVAKGATPYRDQSERSLSLSGNLTSLALTDPSAASASHSSAPDLHRGGGGLRFEAYEQPKVPSAPVLTAQSGHAMSSALPSSWGQEPSRGHQGGQLPSNEFGNILGGGGGGGGDSGGDARLKLQGVQRKWGVPRVSQPAPVREPSDYDLEAAIEASKAIVAAPNGGASSHDASSGLSSSGGAMQGRAWGAPLGRQEPEVSEEKVKLAASLFGGGGGGGRGGKGGGGGGGGGGSSGASGRPRGTSHHRGVSSRAAATARSEAAAPPSAPSAPPPPPAAPLADLMLLDLSDDPPPQSDAAPPNTQTHAVDPFGQLAGLEVPTTGIPLASGIPLGPTANGAGGAHAQSDHSILSPTGVSGGSSGSVAAAGGSSKAATVIQRDATARQVGVASSSMGANPALFKDILGSG